MIELTGMKFSACHGCLDIEKIIPNTFLVDFKGCFRNTDSVSSDKLEDTVDYSLIYRIVAREMDVHSDLLEHLAGRIAKALRAEMPDSLGDFRVSVSKANPMVGGETAWSKVTLEDILDRTATAL